MNIFEWSRKPDFQESLRIWSKKIGCSSGEKQPMGKDWAGNYGLVTEMRANPRAPSAGSVTLTLSKPVA